MKSGISVEGLLEGWIFCTGNKMFVGRTEMKNSWKVIVSVRVHLGQIRRQIVGNKSFAMTIEIVARRYCIE